MNNKDIFNVHIKDAALSFIRANEGVTDQTDMTTELVKVFASHAAISFVTHSVTSGVDLDKVKPVFVDIVAGVYDHYALVAKGKLPDGPKDNSVAS